MEESTMSENKKKAILSAARGSWQYNVASMLASGRPIQSPFSTLRGKAKNYELHYKSSFLSLLSRLQAAGIRIERTPGVRGGEYTATYRVV